MVPITESSYETDICHRRQVTLVIIDYFLQKLQIASCVQ